MDEELKLMAKVLQDIKTQIKSVKDQSSYEIQDLKLEIQHLQLALQIHDLKKFCEEAFEEDMAALGSDDECVRLELWTNRIFATVWQCFKKDSI